MRTFAILLLLLTALFTPAPAQASGRCLFQGDWDCYGPPQWNGPGLNTSNIPGTYGGWTTNQIQCSPVTYQCWQVVSP